MSGKLIVFEGTDGSGKATQSKLLFERLQREGVDCRKLDFPRYGEKSAALVELYLGGAFGTHPSDVNAYAASTFFAVDRYASYKQDWGGIYEGGGLILADRYTTSNAVHQGSKLPQAEQKAFFDWLYDFEYVRMGLPRPDMVIYLDVDIETSLSRIHHREERTGTHSDIHERDTEYLERCIETGRRACEHYGWERIGCFTADGEERDRHEKHEAIFAAIKKAGLV